MVLKKNQKEKGFTLIELLVVIAIIGVISSIVLVNLSGTREKATIARGLQFSQNINNALGAYAVGVWSFDRYQNPITDTSGYGNNCTIVNYPNGAAEAEGIVRKALGFDGTDDYLDCGNSGRLNITDKITIEVWIKPASAQEICGTALGNSGVAGKVESAAGSTNWSWQLRYGSPDSCRLGFQFNTVGAGAQWATAKQNLTVGRWYHIVGTFDGTNIKFYLNGELKDANTLGAPTTIVSNLNKFLIGTEGWANYFNGAIDEVRIYNESLTAGEIQKHYTEGMEGHKNLALKNQ